MADQNYFQWLLSETETVWWHDSGDRAELQVAMANGAIGVTTNPVLACRAVHDDAAHWMPLRQDLATDLTPVQRAEHLTGMVAREAAGVLLRTYEQTAGRHGYACAQVNPAAAGETEVMVSMARRLNQWAPNIAIKLPVTAAGLDALEICAAEGMTITATMSFTVPQVLAVAERFRRARQQALDAGIKPGQCYAVIMIGRLDDYLRDVGNDRKAGVSDAAIREAGVAVSKRAYGIFKERKYEAVLMVAALRGPHHMVNLAGANLVVSVHPTNQALLLEPGVPREQRIDRPVEPSSLQQLQRLPDFVRAYEPDGMAEADFFTYGLTQRTLTNFAESWKGLESY